jgi:acylaminoacyl-peptidase
MRAPVTNRGTCRRWNSSRVLVLLWSIATISKTTSFRFVTETHSLGTVDGRRSATTVVAAGMSSLATDASTGCKENSKDSASLCADRDARAYHEFVAAAVDLSDAHCRTDNNRKNHVLTVIRSVRDIDQNKRRRFLYHLPLTLAMDGDDSTSIPIPPTELHDDVTVRLPSPSGNRTAIFRKEAIADDTTKRSQRQILEIWQHARLERRIVFDTSLHGSIVNDGGGGGFGRPVWNAQETALVYIAERPPPVKPVSFFETTRVDQSPESPPEQRGGQYTLGYGQTEKWGEKYHSQSALLDLFCVAIETGKVGRVENVPGQKDNGSTLGGYTFGQPVFAPDSSAIVYVGWDAGGGGYMPRRLGLVYCQQRPSKLYLSPITQLWKRLSTLSESDDSEVSDEPFTCLTPDHRISRSPQFAPPPANASDGTSLVFLSSKDGFDTHSGCLELHGVSWKQGRVVPDSHSVIVASVGDPGKEQPTKANGDVAGLSFPGLFLQQLPENCFVSGTHLLINTQWGSCVKVVRVDISTGRVDLLPCGNPISSDELLCTTSDGGAILSRKLLNEPTSILYVSGTDLQSNNLASTMKVQSSIQMEPIAGTSFSAILNFPRLDFSCEIHQTDPPKVNGVGLTIPIQSVLLLPDAEQYPKPPLIVVPHGGPHSCSSTSFLPSYAYLCGHGGYAILMVNYRGSTGFGQDSIESLPTRIGELDVKDVIAATLKVQESGIVDAERIGICGGSHGGFLTGHCTSQYPNLFKAAAMRNPVVNIPSMVTSTDIPDWCYVEAIGSYNWREYMPPTSTSIRMMWDKSPIRHVDRVQTPTLVALGMQDLRVPPSQGLEWYHSLRSKGVPTKLLTYDGNDHAIAGVKAEADHWVNIKQWFDNHLKN